MADWLYLEYGMGYDSMAFGDVYDYWQDSLEWREPYDAFHMPGYAFSLALLRGATLGALPPTTILLFTTLVAFAIATIAAYRLTAIDESSTARALGVLAVALFVLWPMVGVTYVAYPIADMFGMAPLLIAIWFLKSRQSLPGGLVLGLTLIAHKGMWPFAILVMLAHLMTKRDPASLAAVVVMLVPVSVIWIMGAAHHDSTFWLLSSNLDFEFQSTNALPVFDGLLGSFISGGVSGIGKGTMIGGVALLAIAVVVQSWRAPKDDDRRWYALALGAAILTLVVLLNEREVWVIVRFGRLLAIPLAWYFGPLLLANLDRLPMAKSGLIGALSVLVISQIAFGYYVSRIWVYDPI
ncbi:MAG: hypothetical protein H8E48_10850 [Chloroflexi bacterium]|nr:hypothetical protein [Chloroflexota bacterium]